MHSARLADASALPALRREEAPLPAVASGSDASMRFYATGRLLVVWHGLGNPMDEAWDRSIRTIDAARDRPYRVLVLTEGGGPSAAQQLRLTRLLSARSTPLPIAVISDNTGVRFVASTLALFTKRIRTFRSTELPLSLAFLALDPGEVGTVRWFLSQPPADASG